MWTLANNRQEKQTKKKQSMLLRTKFIIPLHIMHINIFTVNTWKTVDGNIALFVTDDNYLTRTQRIRDMLHYNFVFKYLCNVKSKLVRFWRNKAKGTWPSTNLLFFFFQGLNDSHHRCESFHYIFYTITEFTYKKISRF